MGVTPQILSRAVTDPLTRYITEQLADTNAGDTWRTYLLRRTAHSLAIYDPVAAWTVSCANRELAFADHVDMLCKFFHVCGRSSPHFSA